MIIEGSTTKKQKGVNESMKEAKTKKDHSYHIKDKKKDRTKRKQNTSNKVNLSCLQ